jgi:hypothetical protein
MNLWQQWKKGFDAWEKATAEYLSRALENPAVLGPAGALLTAAMKAKAAGDRVAHQFWGGLGLATKRDQERGLHKLNVLESKLLDLEERLASIEGEGRRGAGSNAA